MSFFVLFIVFVGAFGPLLKDTSLPFELLCRI